MPWVVPDKGVHFKGLHTQLFAKWSFVRSNGDTEAGALMFGSQYFILIKYQLFCQVSNAGTDVCVCVCASTITSTVSLYQQNQL